MKKPEKELSEKEKRLREFFSRPMPRFETEEEYQTRVLREGGGGGPAPISIPQVFAKGKPAFSVCSDVHLGTKYSEKKNFYQWLKQRRPHETVILLGDILDFWIFSKHDDKDNLLRRIVAEWEQLWTVLARLQKQGTQIHYIPGNHDVFVFFIETADLLPWSKAVMAHSKEFQFIKKAIGSRLMREVASIHYPFYQVEVGGLKVLFTHGHYEEWYWRQVAGFSDAPVESALFLTTASIVLAHKYARIVRRAVNETDWLKRVHGIEDAAISITNSIVRAHAAAHRSIEREPQKAVKLIDLALSIYFHAKSNISKSEWIAIRDALLSLGDIQGRQVPKDLQAIWDNTMKYLGRSRRERSVTVERDPRTTSFTSFSNFLTPDRLVFGHYHIPREDDKAYDVGGFVKPISTYFIVRGDGSIDRDY